MNFSLIIVNYNTAQLLKNCLDSIFKSFNDNDFEVIIVDNNSKDDSLKKIEIFGDKIKIIKNNKNYGFGRANNIGAKIAKGEYLFFLNSDTIINNDILGIISETFSQDRKIAVLSPKLILKNGLEQKHAYGNFPGILNIIFGKAGDLKINSKPSEKKPELNPDWVSGAAMIIRKEIFDKIGGFDENFFMYFEDIDICKRVKDIEYEVLYLKQASLIHLGGGSQKKFSKTKIEYYKSQDYFFKKHYGFFSMLLMKFIRLPYKIFILFFSKF